MFSSEDDGGLARIASTLARRLPERGIDTAVALQRAGRVGASLEAAGVSVDVVPDLPELLDRMPDGRRSLAAVPRNIVRLPEAVRRLREIARRHCVDILYSHGSWANHLASEAARGLPGVGVVWHVHTAPARLNTFAARVAARRGDLRGIVAVSNAAAVAYRALPPPVHVVYNGIPLEVCAAAAREPVLRQKLGIPPAAFVFGYAGRLVAHKGVDVLADAALRVLREVPAAHFVLLGGNPRSVRRDTVGELRSRFEATGFSHRVHLPGYVDDVLQWVAGFDLAVAPATYPDPCPLAVIEALALGVPVVASRIGGIPELVDDGIDGRLVAPGERDDLAATIVALARNVEIRRAMAVAARQAATARFDERHMVDRVAGVLQQSAERG